MGAASAADSSVKHVQSIDRALDVLEALATEPDGLSLGALAARTGLSKSTAHRILAALAQRDWTAQREDGSYQLGLKLI
ncbi:MAG: helix-turn-helix domain-containing protein, partial [Coriobacteriales bacterium]|nr:helix-turn-helix domain-containing protein [Coriobacteriales bacterium]